MKVVFVSNFFNHHQKPFSDAMYQILGDQYFFISTSVMPEERRKLGYAQGNYPAYVILAYESLQQRQKVLELINDADVVITGSAPNELFRERIHAGKLLLRYSERPYKKGSSFLKRLYHMVRLRQRDQWSKNVYMMCASAYTAQDYNSLGMYKGRTYKWGYFPEVKAHDIDRLMEGKKRNMILWCGRFIDWKHPDDAIRIAEKLKADGYDFQLNMIGTGSMEAQLKRKAENSGVGDRVRFLGSMPPEQVRYYMEEASVYLFTSDRQEGWGAVLNEAMASGCAVVASHAIGAVPYLIKDGENGLIYPSGDVNALYDHVKKLLDDPAEAQRVGENAYQTLWSEWNAQIAAARFIQLAEHMTTRTMPVDLFENGPCSRAEVIKDDWFEGQCQR